MQTKQIWTPMAALALLGAVAVASPQKNGLADVASAGHPESAGDARASSAPESDSTPANLPVRRVVLYKSGVAYFEHLGRVSGGQTVRIDFTSGQLNDVLQSLTILDLNGGRIAGVSYNSEAPVSQRLGTLRLPLEEKTDLTQFYTALRGAQLEIRSGTTTVTGRLLNVERKTRTNGAASVEVDLATLVSDSGEVRTVELTPDVTVRLAEHDVNEEVGRYLSLLGSERQQDLRRMNIATAGTGERQLYVSYVSEVPIWKTTYRVVLPSKEGEEPLLQGWAIVDNTVGEDWNDVELALVAGAPQSFIQQLSQPYYARRPVIALPQSMQLTPQTHEEAIGVNEGQVSGDVTDPSGAAVENAAVSLVNEAGQTVATTSSNSEGHYQFDAVPAGNYTVKVAMNGFKQMMIRGLPVSPGNGSEQDVKLQTASMAETVEVSAQNSAVMLTALPKAMPTRIAGGYASGAGSSVGGAIFTPAPPPISISEARNMQQAAATGGELGDLFEYKLKDRVTIHKNESALVPIVQAHVKAEKVSLWNASLGTPRPLRALWLTNSSGETLDGGSFTVLEDETFAGEGLTEAIKPDEKRLLSYAADLGVRVSEESNTGPQHALRVHVAKGGMTLTAELWQDSRYIVRDDDTAPRAVLIEHPLRGGWTLAGDAPKPEETTSNLYRFRVNVGAKQTAGLDVREMQRTSTYYQLNQITEEQIKFLVQQGSINADVEAALRRILEKKHNVAGFDSEVSRREAERKKIFEDQQRLRENLKALKGSAEERALTLRYTQQLSDEETRLAALQQEESDLQKKRDQGQAELDKMIADLTLDATISQ